MGAKRKSIQQKLKSRKMCSLKGNRYFFPKRKRKQVRLNEQWCTVNARISAELQISAPLRISAPPKAQNL